MRLSNALLLFVITSACVGHRTEARREPAPVRFVADNVAELGVVHGIGGWGNGANYSFAMTRDGIAHYEGGLRATLSGVYKARIDTSTVTALIDEAVQPGRLAPQGYRCADLPTTSITILTKDGARSTFGADCQAPDGNRRFAARLDSLFATLSWYPAKRAT